MDMAGTETIGLLLILELATGQDLWTWLGLRRSDCY
jgi:hypothetical protein